MGVKKTGKKIGEGMATNELYLTFWAANYRAKFHQN